MSTQLSPNEVTERIGQLCSEFKLPTVGAEAAPWFTRAGHPDALQTLLEVLEQEAEDRQTATYHPAQTCLQAACRQDLGYPRA